MTDPPGPEHGPLPGRGPVPSRQRRPIEAPCIPGLVDLVGVGRGGMGAVFRARDERLGRTVAVKVLAGSAAMSPDGHRQVDREARILTRIAHPNIVRVLFVTESGGAPAIVLEWIDGPTLEDHGRDAALPPREAAAIVADLARAVAAVHACGVVHRDITPANVLLAAGDGRPIPKLIDFGLARPDAEALGASSRTEVALGTPPFMAPEQTGLDASLGPVGPATDIHGLGALLYWLLSGHAPYDAATEAGALRRAAAAEAPALSSARRPVPRDLRTIVEKCLARRPERRYRSADELADDLGRFLAHRPIRARRAGPVERLAKWARRRPALAALATSVAMAAAALAIMGVHHVRRLERATVAITVSRDGAIQAAAAARAAFDTLTDSTAERLLARGGVQDQDDRDHLRRIRDEYRDWPLEPDPAAALRFRAAGLERLAKIFLRLGLIDDCLDATRIAIDDLGSLDAMGLSGADDRRRRVDLELLRCGLLLSVDRCDEAAAAASATVTRLEAGVVRNGPTPPQLPAALSGLAVAETRRGDRAAAARTFRRALAACDAMLDRAPVDAATLSTVLPVYFNAAATPWHDSPEECHALYERLVALAQDGLERFDTDRETFGSSALMGLAAMAEVDLELGRPAEALAHVRDRVALGRTLAAEMPHSEMISSDPHVAVSQAWRCHRALGRPGDAEAELAAAAEAAARAAAAAPALVGRARTLVWSLEARAEMEEALGRRDAALATRRQIVAAALPWSSGPGADPSLVARAAEAEAAIARLSADGAGGTGEVAVPPAPP